MRKPVAGTVMFDGGAMPERVDALVGLGVARVPEDRHGTGVVGDLPLWENAVSEHLRSPAFSRWGWVRRRAALAFAQRVIQRFEVRGAGPFAAARTLSGGNMQKLILGRALLGTDDHAPPKRLIVAHQPTWGLDIGSVDYVQQQLMQARDDGAAILLISDDLDEVLALGDRIAVLHAGRLTAALPASAWSRGTVGLAMAGLRHEAAAETQPGSHAPAVAGKIP
jgi:simple sugar transport system ATP-binding protein